MKERMLWSLWSTDRETFHRFLELAKQLALYGESRDRIDKNHPNARLWVACQRSLHHQLTSPCQGFLPAFRMHNDIFNPSTRKPLSFLPSFHPVSSRR